MRRDERDTYESWLSGELLLFGLLGAALALFVDYAALRHAWEAPALGLVLDTAITLAGGIVAVLAGIRFAVEGRRFDLVLSSGFFVAACATLLFEIVPVLDAPMPARVEGWAAIFGALFAALYPLTQLYQFDEDSRRGDRTFALVLGKVTSLRVSLAATGLAFAFFRMARHGTATGRWTVPALVVALGAWLVVLVPWVRNAEAWTPAQHQRGMHMALGAWAITDVAVLLGWGALGAG